MSQSPRTLRFAKRAAAISVFALLASALNPANALMTRVFDEATTERSWLGIALMALSHGAVIAWLIEKTPLRGLRLALWLGALYGGINGVMAQIETWAFLSLWNPVLNGEAVGIIFLHQLSFGLLLAGLTGLAFRTRREPVASPILLPHGTSLAGRIAAAATLYVPVYLLAGAFIAVPLGGEAFQQVYGQLKTPAWMPLFQLARGFGWAGLALLTLRYCTGHRWHAMLTGALVLAVPMDAGLLLENPLFPDALRWAHFVEVGVSMLVYGWLVGALLTPRVRPAPGLHARAAQAAHA